MIASTPRDPWRAAWQIAVSDRSLIVLLLGLAFGLALATCLPQMPWADPASYAQWFSVTQEHFGQATAVMRSLGLFTILRSFGFRLLLALLFGCLSLRLVESIDRFRRHKADPPEEWHTLTGLDLSTVLDDLRTRRYRLLGESPLFQADRWPWADLFPLLSHTGALLLLVSLLVTHLWGWQVKGVVVQSGERITLPGSGKWVALAQDGQKITHSPGLVTFVEQRGPGVQVSVTDSAGRQLALHRTVESEPVTQLRVALTEDRYFAIPEAQMVVRLVAQQDAVLVQVYRSPPGQLIAGQVVEGDAELAVKDVTLELATSPYAQLTVTFNPGLWPSGVGVLLLAAGLLGNIAWPARRFWLRQKAGRVQVAGDTPSIPTPGEGS